MSLLKRATAALAKAGMSAEEAEAIYRLTSLPSYQERFVIPPYSREGDIEETYVRSSAKPRRVSANAKVHTEGSVIHDQRFHFHVVRLVC